MEIEKSVVSRVRSQMENDDEERDLDKETPEFHIASHRRTTPGMRLVFFTSPFVENSRQYA